MSQATTTAPAGEQAEQGLPRIIFASAAGTMIEWYDFYIFGSLATVISSKFYQTGTPLGDLIAWLAAFAVGFIVRPFGAIVFGRVGDLIGRKYTFLVTMTLMGLCTFAVGLLPTAEQIGPAAGIILIGLRILQGLALGGEYGGAATYVAEHAPQGRRGFMTSWIITQTKRFKAASVGAAVTNLVSFNGTTDIPGFVPDYFGGQSWDRPQAYLDHSPIFHVKGVSTPTLIQHCEGDLRVPISQGYEFYNALKQQGVPVRMLVLPRQTHGPTEPRALLKVMETNLDWFAQGLLK